MSYITEFIDYILTPDLDSTLVVIDILATVFVFGIGLFVLFLVGIYVNDKLQRNSALKANFPIFVRARYWSEDFGKFIRSWVLAPDREELPFNRTQRGWVYKAARDISNYQSFGSTRKVDAPGTIIFGHSAFPKLAEEKEHPKPPLIGAKAKKPYQPSSFFNISGMSYGAISPNAILSLSKGAAKGGFWMNTGEGGLSPNHLAGGADIVFQVGTAKYGVRDEEGNLSDEKLAQIAAHDQVKMFEVKMSQGAKPGSGGVLPEHKITEEIAHIRGIPMHKDSVSPNRHKEINNIEDLLNFMQHIREVTQKPVGFKISIGDNSFVEDLVNTIKDKGVQLAPDFITIDSGDGGTGAAPSSLFDYAGQLIRESLPYVHQALSKAGLRDDIRLIVSGKLINPADIGWAIAMGADFITSARGFLFSLGCIQALQCSENTCPTGIATQDAHRSKALVPEKKYVRVYNYHKNLVYEVEKLALACGVTHPWALNSHHIRIVMSNYKTIPVSEWMNQ